MTCRPARRQATLLAFVRPSEAMLTEFFYVFAYSKRAQFALVVGFGFFVGLMIGGEYATDHLELRSIPGPLVEVIRDNILHRYQKAAWTILCMSVLAAAKFYRKDRKRLLDL